MSTTDQIARDLRCEVTLKRAGEFGCRNEGAIGRELSAAGWKCAACRAFEALATLQRVEHENEEWTRSFALFDKATRALTKAWHDAHPAKRDVWPDTTRLCQWAAAQLESMTARAAQLSAALKALDNTLLQVDNGYCGICRTGHRLYDTKGKPQRCSNDECVSHQVREALSLCANAPAQATT